MTNENIHNAPKRMIVLRRLEPKRLLMMMMMMMTMTMMMIMMMVMMIMMMMGK